MSSEGEHKDKKKDKEKRKRKQEEGGGLPSSEFESKSSFPSSES